MALDLSFIYEQFPDLLSSAISRERGTIAYRIKLPALEPGRGFEWAELRLPKEFPERAKAFIQLSPDAVLRVPHIDSAGVLCIESDPGPNLGLSVEERIVFTLHAYFESFLKPWLNADLDGDFETEALNYWAIEVANARSNTDPASGVWTLDSRPAKAMLREGLLLRPNRIIIAADEKLLITNRVVQSMGYMARQRIRVQVADIPISHTFTPSTWPRSMSDLDCILKGRLSPAEYSKFQSCRSRRDRSTHRVVLFRSADAAFAYLLPGGPPTVLDVGRGKKTFPPLCKPLPLMTSRLDPNWTVGRDQHPEVSERQTKHVLVLGAGALGSPIIDHLAKAGIGKISVVDADIVSSANIGRHLLGAESIGDKKVNAIARRINSGYPATEVIPYAMSTAEWLKRNPFANIDVVLDLTGEPEVRMQIEEARQNHQCPLLIGWMEPYVAAAHACMLPAGQQWLKGGQDPLSELEAVEWPKDVLRKEPGCSSRFQSYTAAAAAYAVALVAECALAMIDNSIASPDSVVRSWVRGQHYLDKHWPGLKHKTWAEGAILHDGLTIIRKFHE
ncbi:HesA/MoeB/ThiF family protein [Aeromonas media]|uniref:HesA/MoeB/ThiF family protein n=1 Tax=Aeromonas media TaxID=651 RepID=UPI0019238DC7|nr:ThiF family adenylyltransferase [Aeromonas media]MBL0511958.1 ThiF family adenylyltransferase [Aeromonas media]